MICCMIVFTCIVTSEREGGREGGDLTLSLSTSSLATISVSPVPDWSTAPTLSTQKYILCLNTYILYVLPQSLYQPGLSNPVLRPRRLYLLRREENVSQCSAVSVVLCSYLQESQAGHQVLKLIRCHHVRHPTYLPLVLVINSY